MTSKYLKNFRYYSLVHRKVSFARFMMVFLPGTFIAFGQSDFRNITLESGIDDVGRRAGTHVPEAFSSAGRGLFDISRGAKERNLKYDRIT